MQDTKASRAFLLAAIGVGVLAMVLAWAYLQGAATSIAANAPKAKVLAARHDLFPTQVLDPEKDLVEQVVDKDWQWRYQCLQPEDKGTCKGERVNRRILAGEPIRRADLQGSVDLVVTGDERLISIPVRGPAALGGNLIPGDWVKVYSVVGSTKVVPTTMGSMEATTVHRAQADLVVPEELKVVAVGTRLMKSRLQLMETAQFDAANSSQSAQSVTLMVNEAQAKRILEAIGVEQTPLWLVMCPRQAAATAP